MISGSEALAQLKAGNHRFVQDSEDRGAAASPARVKDLTQGQEPFAIILGCADSRVPAEIVFDQGLGDLFVIRVAGNIVEPSLIGSVEYAAQFLGTPLVVVLGHSSCGAIAATLGDIDEPNADLSPNLRAIVDRIRPAVEAVSETDADARSARAVRANVSASVQQLSQGSEVLKKLIQENNLLVVGAEYSLETGKVDFFEGVPKES